MLPAAIIAIIHIIWMEVPVIPAKYKWKIAIILSILAVCHVIQDITGGRVIAILAKQIVNIVMILLTARFVHLDIIGMKLAAGLAHKIVKLVILAINVFLVRLVVR